MKLKLFTFRFTETVEGFDDEPMCHVHGYAACADALTIAPDLFRPCRTNKTVLRR